MGYGSLEMGRAHLREKACNTPVRAGGQMGYGSLEMGRAHLRGKLQCRGPGSWERVMVLTAVRAAIWPETGVCRI